MGVYLDHQATSPMSDGVKQAYLEALDVVGNPSSIHHAGQKARAILEDSRERIAQALGCEPIEIVLTSGGTEAINTALKGALWAAEISHPDAPAALVATGAEHHATLDALGWLVSSAGATWHAPRVDPHGVIDTDHLREILSSGPAALVSSLLANNEVGSLQPVGEVVEIAREYGVPTHLDAVAALGYIPVNFVELGVTAMSVSAHKVGGPVGVGALVLSRHAPAWEALHHGGEQQRGRSGTLNVAGTVGFAAALEARESARVRGSSALAALRDRLEAGVLAQVPEVVVRGSGARLPGNLNITVPGCEGDVLLYLLDQEGIHVSTGSACQAGVPEASHVLLAMGVSEADARGALRFSLSYSTTQEDIDQVISVFAEVVAKARVAGLAASSSGAS
jgi:cysteine desulfurase